MFLIAGLGNPGKQYEGTRHNIGFEVIDYISKEYGILLEDGSVTKAILAGKMRLNDYPVVGDYVNYAFIDNVYVIQSIDERKNYMIRPNLANVDQAIIMMSLKDPDFSYELVNRLIILIECSNVEPIVCISKCDLGSQEKVDEIEEYLDGCKFVPFSSTNISVNKEEIEEVVTEDEDAESDVTVEETEIIDESIQAEEIVEETIEDTEEVVDEPEEESTEVVEESIPEEKVVEENLDAEKESIWNRVLAFISGSITPTLPVLIGSGMISAILSLAANVFHVDTAGSTYTLLNTLANAAYTYLPVLVAFAAARRLKTNEYVAAFIVLALCTPAISGVADLKIFGLPITSVKYTSNIVPALLMVPVMAFIDRYIVKYSPKSIVSITRQIMADTTSSVRLFQIVGLASVEGSIKHNCQLAEGRAEALKKYIQDGTEAKGQKCPNCGHETLVYQEGCLICKHCGSSRCG